MVGDTPVPRDSPLAHLPPAVAERLEFDRAAPRRWRSDKVPAEARLIFSTLWDAVAAEVYDELAGRRGRDRFRRETIVRVLARVGTRLQEAERALLVCAVHYPIPAGGRWRHVATAGIGSGGAAAVQTAATFGSIGTGAVVAGTAAIVGELFETYVAASARTDQYRKAGRSPDPALVATDLAQATGFTAAAGRRTNRELTSQVVVWLGARLLDRTSSRFVRGFVPVAGAVASAGVSSYDVWRVGTIPLRPAAPDEAERLRAAALGQPADPARAYRADLGSFLGLTPPTPPPPPPPPAAPGAPGGPAS